MINSEILVSTSYLPAIQYLKNILSATIINVEAMENYPKQTLRNRCFIYAANGPLCLTIPVQKKTNPFQYTKDILIDYTDNWQKIHWRSIVSAYNSTPFFMYYEHLFKPFYNKKIKYLLDFNNEQLSVILNEVFKLKIDIATTKEYVPEIENEKDLRYLCNYKSYKIKSMMLSKKEYYQVFASKFGFIANLSIIDLLFNEGKETMAYLNESIEN
jgi:hypothetical protein